MLLLLYNQPVIAGGAVYPAPDKVSSGAQYGPNGTDFTGTLSASSGGAYIRRR